MKQSIPHLILAALALSASPLMPGETAVDYAPVIEELSSFIDKEIKRLHVPGLSIALVDGQRIVWLAGFGMQDPDRTIPATGRTVYRPASLSKLLTAVAVMHLHEKGVLNIHAPITTYLPQMIFRDRFGSKEAITLRHLMAHRAGILRESPVGNYFDDSDPGIEATVKSIIGTDLVHPVGTVTKYSNLGPTVAGYILQKLTGVEFSVYMDRHLFRPVNMRSTSFLKKGALIEKNLARGYMVGFDGTYFPAPYLNLGTIPAGNSYSTAGDLARFMLMLIAGGTAGDTRILKEQTVKEMFTIQFPEEGKSKDFGLGFFVSRRGKRKAISHAGAIYGFSSLFTCLPEEKLGVIVLNSVDCTGGLNHKVTARALDCMLHRKCGDPIVPLPAAVDMKGLNVREYTGLYRSQKRTARIVVKNGSLAANVTGYDMILSPLSRNRFIADCRISYGTRVEFLRGDRGEITGVNIDGSYFARMPGYRRDDTIPAQWNDLVGYYGWPHNTMKIFARDGQLICLVEWFYQYPMKQTGDRSFLFPDYGLYSNEKLVFEKNADGTIRGAVMANVFFKRLRSLGRRP